MAGLDHSLDLVSYSSQGFTRNTADSLTVRWMINQIQKIHESSGTEVEKRMFVLLQTMGKGDSSDFLQPTSTQTCFHYLI